jgi:hypothetical protein
MNFESRLDLEFFGASETAHAVLTRTALSLTMAAGRGQTAAAATAVECDPRTYLCDEESHIVHVLDEHCRPMFSFGGFGSGLGQFDTPTEASVVWASVDPAMPAVGSSLLVVADRGNDRIQLFETDGVAIGAIGGATGASESRPAARAAWPFFRLDDGPSLNSPSSIEWRAPFLDVTCEDGVVRVDLAVALLPDFNTWIECASAAELRQAFDRFMSSPEPTEVPDWCLYEIADRLQPWSNGERLAS